MRHKRLIAAFQLPLTSSTTNHFQNNVPTRIDISVAILFVLYTVVDTSVFKFSVTVAHTRNLHIKAFPSRTPAYAGVT